MEILGWHDTPLRSVMHSVTSVSRWPGVMCCGNGYLLWERVNKAGKTHKIPCVNRVWAGGCYEEMGLGERERETSEPWVRWQVELVVVVGNLCTAMSRDRARPALSPVWSVIQILTVTMTCHPWPHGSPTDHRLSRCHNVPRPSCHPWSTK